MTSEVTHIRSSRLANGLTVVSDPMPSVETVTVGVWVGVGTRDEAATQNGVAHLLEHMAFKGTTSRTAQQIVEEIESVGGYVNAYTSRETTAYYARVLTEDLPLAIGILGDILQHSTFEPAELERERDVIVQEIGQALDTPEDVVFDRFQEKAYPGQGIGRSVLGTTEIVQGLARNDIMDFMARHYSADNMALVAAGNIDHEALVALAEDAFDTLARHAAPISVPARYEGGDTRLARAGEQVHVLIGLDALPMTDPDYYAALVLSQALGGGMSSPLFQEIREKRGLAYAIYSFLAGYRDCGTFGIYAGTGPEKVDELIRVVCDELTAASERVTDAALDSTKRQLRAGILMGMESSQARADQIGTQLLTLGRIVPVDEMARSIDSVTRSDLARVFGRLRTSRPTFAALGPLGDIMAFDTIARRLDTQGPATPPATAIR